MTWVKVLDMGEKFLDDTFMGGHGWEVWDYSNGVNLGAGGGFYCGLIGWKHVRIVLFYMS